MATFLLKHLSIYKVDTSDNSKIIVKAMDVIYRHNRQTRLESEYFYDKKSRDNYFEMLKIALLNLALVDWNNKN